MFNFLKKFGRVIFPKSVRVFLWNITPRFSLVNTYLLKQNHPIENLSPINEKYIIRKVGQGDMDKIEQFELQRNPEGYKDKVHSRLQSDAWTGLATIDSENNEIAYLAWVIQKSIPYFEEFSIKLKDYQFLLKDGYCDPRYRHQGLHSRMEQERINYCIEHGGTEIFIQIHYSNQKGVTSVLGNDYKLYQQNYVIQWPMFNTYRSLTGFLKNPGRKIVK